MVKRLMFLIISLAVLLGMGLATTAAIAGDGLYGQLRWRWEGWNNLDDADSDNDDGFGYNFMRTRLGYSTEIGERGMFNFSIENTRVMGFDGVLSEEGYWWGPYKAAPWYWDTERVVIHEANMGIADFLFKGFDAYAGRFSLSYGRERIIGPEDWAFYTEHRFDGFKGHYAFEKGWMDLFCLKLWESFVEKYDGSYDNGDEDLRGIYAHFDAAEGMYIEPYVLWYSTDNWGDEDEGYTYDNDSYYVFGALFDYMSDAGLHFYAEGVMVSGTENEPYYEEDDEAVEYDISGLGFYAGLFYEFNSELKPFVGAELNYASGTKMEDYENNEYKTFCSPYGSFSSYMGVMNMIDWSNTMTLRFSGGLTPVEGTDVKLDFYMFKLASDEDTAYGARNLLNFSDDVYDMDSLWGEDADDDGVFDSKSVGTEIDFFVNHKIEDGVTLEGGVSMFSFGDYFGADNDYDSILFGWLGAQVDF